MNILIPIGGTGERFKEDGYSSPKPLINVMGKLMIQHVIDCLNLNKEDTVIIVYNKLLKDYSFEERIKCKNNIIFIQLPNQTKGAAETVLYGLQNIPSYLLRNNTIILDCDNFYTMDILQMYRNNNCKNAVFSFDDTLSKPIYSYVKINARNRVLEIREKVKISDNANTGCYCFESGTILKTYCSLIMEKKILENNEYYISCVIKEMLKDPNCYISCIKINKDHFHCLGTPMHVKIFCSNNKHLKECKKLRICFDLDNCLVTSPAIEGDYTTVRPIHKNINILNYLHDCGHTIIIHTARRMRTHSGNVMNVIQDIGPLTFNQLNTFNIKYDEVYFGKPYAHFYIDDLAVNSFGNIQKEIGFYDSSVKEREFNQLQYKSIEVVTKKSKDTLKIQAEIAWYKSIPKELTALFPKLYDYSTDYYNIEFIHGLTFSYLYTHQLLTIEMFSRFLKAISAIHHERIYRPKDIDLYGNYGPKLFSRYAEHIAFYKEIANNNVEETYKKIHNFLEEYKKQDSGKWAMIHGDPVFSNVMMDKDNEIKLFDMRGLLGKHITQCGDSNYDYAKIYQSLIGYDEILLKKNIDEEYREHFMQEFKKYLGNERYIEIKNLTNSLLFSLIPLHKENKYNCKLFYKLIR